MPARRSAAAMSPGQRYRQLLAAGQLVEDAHQAQAVQLLDDLHRRLEQRPRLFRRRRSERGLYLWGGVGRGKTLLMDLFHDCLRQRKLRLHWHRFMRRVQRELQAKAGAADPLRLVAEGFARRARILCFDEFFVSDIGDAMILGELLRHLFDRGVTLVATSNLPPGRLYENGLQRRRFLPAIEALEARTLVHCLGGDLDHRLRLLQRAPLYHWPLDDQAERSLAASFAALAPEQPKANQDLEIEGRQIRARQVADDLAWFDFPELCEGPRSQNDYIELARCHHAVLISGVPRFGPADEDAARRFISLVDEFYDRNVKLILSAQAPIAELYAGERLNFEFQRTQSRLTEMQSRAYLARSHKAG